MVAMREETLVVRWSNDVGDTIPYLLDRRKSKRGNTKVTTNQERIHRRREWSFKTCERRGHTT